MRVQVGRRGYLEKEIRLQRPDPNIAGRKRKTFLRWMDTVSVRMRVLVHIRDSSSRLGLMIEKYISHKDLSIPVSEVRSKVGNIIVSSFSRYWHPGASDLLF